LKGGRKSGLVALVRDPAGAAALADL